MKICLGGGGSKKGDGIGLLEQMWEGVVMNKRKFQSSGRGWGHSVFFPSLLRPWCHCICINMTHTLARENEGEKCIHLEKFEFLSRNLNFSTLNLPKYLIKHQHLFSRARNTKACYLSFRREILSFAFSRNNA